MARTLTCREGACDAHGLYLKSGVQGEHHWVHECPGHGDPGNFCGAEISFMIWNVYDTDDVLVKEPVK